MIGPACTYLLKVTRDMAQEGDATPSAVAARLGAQTRERIEWLLVTGHLRLVGGHLDVSATGLAAIAHDDNTNPIEHHERAIGLWPSRR